MGQLRGMYEGDRSRKLALIDAGFRLPVGARQPARCSCPSSWSGWAS